MEKSQFIAMVEEITGAHVIDRTDDTPLSSGARKATVPHNAIEFDGVDGIVGGVLSMSGSADDYRSALGGLAAIVPSGAVVYLDKFRSWGGEGEPNPPSAFGHKIDFFITLPAQ